MTKYQVTLFALATILSFNSFANAKTLRLSLDRELMGFSISSQEHDGMPKLTQTKFGLGPGRSDRLVDGITLGVAAPDLGMGIGFCVNNLVTIGTRIALGFDILKPKAEDQAEQESWGDESTYTSVYYGFLPYVDFTFGAGKVRPYLTATLGLEGTILKYTGADVEERLWDNLFIVGGGGGIHIFPASSLSLDLGLLAEFGIGRGNYETTVHDNSSTDERSLKSINLAVLAGLSAWI